MDEVEGCDVCGGDHTTEVCPELGLVVSRETPIQTKARLTLPEGLDVIEDENGNCTVIALQPISAKTQFGPFEARKTTFSIDSDNIFVLKVFTKDGGVVCFDTTDENYCNWLCLVRTAESAEDQNLIAYTLGVNIFYNSTKDIAAGQELRVWYAPAYARKLGKLPTPDGVTTTMLGEMLIFQEDDTLPQIEAATAETREQVPAQNVCGNDSRVSDDVVDVKCEALFQCAQCSSTFQSQSDYVRHLREHLMPSRDKPQAKSSIYKCKTCQVGFNTYSNYNRHMKKHDGNRIECPICKHNTYRADLFTTHYVGKHKQSYEEAKRILSEHSFEKIPKKSREGEGEAATEEGGDGESRTVIRRKRGRPRKKRKITDDDDEEVENNSAGVAGAAVTSDENKVDEGDGDDENENESECESSKKPRLVESHECLECDKSSDSEFTLQKHEVDHRQVQFKQEQVSPVRIQPRRSLKGRRITGKLAESDEESPRKENVRVDNTSSVVTPGKKARGRPRKKSLPAEDKEGEEAAKVAEKKQEEEEVSEKKQEEEEEVSERKEEEEEGEKVSCEESKEEWSDLQTEESKASETALENEIVHVLIGLGENRGQKTEIAEMTKDTEKKKGDENTSQTNPESSESDTKEKEESGDPESPDSEQDDLKSDDEDFVPRTQETRRTIIRRRPGRPPGSFRKRPVDREITELEKLTTVEDSAAGGKVYACGVCGKKFEQPSYLRLHLPRHTSKFRCRFCGKSFARKESFQKHDCRARNIEIVTEDKDGARVFTCAECKKSFETWEKARQHTLQHAGAFSCHLCHQTFSRRHLLLDHICRSSDGSVKELFTCEICQQEFRTLRYLYRHMAMHTDIFKCDSCEKTFSRKDSLQRHILKCDPKLASEQNIFPCTVCKKVFSTKLGLENHQINCARYVCETCRLAFFSEENLDQHRCMGKITHDDASIHYACTECGKSFASINYLRRHEMNHVHNYNCEICDKPFAHQDQFNFHYKLCWARKKITDDGHVECDLCKQLFEDAKEYREHYQSHTHPHRCDACGKRFIKIGTLAMHVCNTAAEEEQTVACKECSKLFKSQKALERHQVKHSEPTEQCEFCHKKFHRLQDHICHRPDGNVVRVVYKKNRMLIKENLVCHECGRSFVSVSNLNKHILIHGERQNECDICGKKFHYANYLREHKKMVHMKAYRLQCSDCGKVLFSKTGLVAHMRQFHDNEIKLYQCPQCPKTFRQKGNMKTHLFSHTKVKGFTCEYCGKMFKYPDQYNRHKLEHTMTNKIECALCDKKFCREYQHRKHMELHHSGMVYICDVCNERCSHRHTIIRHYKRKHPDVARVFEQEPDYVERLQKPVNAAEEPQQQVAVKLETVIATDEHGIERAYTIHTDRDDGYLPQVAAEALQNLSSGVMQAGGMENGSIGTIEGPDGEQTVVILQIVNSDETSIQEASIEEVQTIIEENEVIAE